MLVVKMGRKNKKGAFLLGNKGLAPAFIILIIAIAGISIGVGSYVITRPETVGSPILHVGDTWILRDENIGEYTIEVIGEENFRKRPCYVMAGHSELGDSKTWVDKERFVLLKFEMYARTYTHLYQYPNKERFPYWVGKEYKVISTDIEPSGDVKTKVRNYIVEKREKITVPAGSFMAFKVVERDENGNITFTRWYSEEVKHNIKVVDENNQVTELVNYSLVDQSGKGSRKEEAQETSSGKKQEESGEEAQENPKAEFKISDLTVDPPEVTPEEPVKISVGVSNVGGIKGTHTVELEINGMIENSQTVTLDGGKSTTITFKVLKKEEGIYNIGVANLSDSFSIESSTPAQTPTGNLTLETIGDGTAEWTTEVAHSGDYSVKLTIPEGATSLSWGIVKVPYGETFNKLSPHSFYLCANVKRYPRFMIYLDRTGNSKVDKRLLSDYLELGSGKWIVGTGGLRWGWTEWTESGWGDTWESYDYWRNQYNNAKVLYLGVGLGYWTAEKNLGEALYVDDITINNITYDLEPEKISSKPTPTPSVRSIISDVTITVQYDSWESNVIYLQPAKGTWYLYDKNKNLVETYSYQSYSTNEGGTWGGYIPSGEDGYVHLKATSEDGEVEWWPSENEMYMIERGGTPSTAKTEIKIKHSFTYDTIAAPGEPVEITALVKNVGNKKGSRTFELKINGIVEDTRTVTLAPGEKTTISFSVIKYEVGVYNISLGAQSGSFEIVK